MGIPNGELATQGGWVSHSHNDWRNFPTPLCNTLLDMEEFQLIAQMCAYQILIGVLNAFKVLGVVLDTNPFSYTTDPYISLVYGLGQEFGINFSFMTAFLILCCVFMGIVAFALLLIVRAAKTFMS